MGYYTSYDIAFEGDLEQQKAFKEELLKRTAYSDGRNDSQVFELLDSGCVYAKLYELDDNITAIAPNYPDLLIMLTGDGEESGDVWEKRWKGNETELQEAVVPPFQNSNLFTEKEKSNH